MQGHPGTSTFSYYSQLEHCLDLVFHFLFEMDWATPWRYFHWWACSGNVGDMFYLLNPVCLGRIV
jgi:hypothetical protein